MFRFYYGWEQHCDSFSYYYLCSPRGERASHWARKYRPRNGEPARCPPRASAVCTGRDAQILQGFLVPGDTEDVERRPPSCVPRN